VGIRILTLAVLVIVLGAWELAASNGWVDKVFTSRPSEIWGASFRFYQSSRFVESTTATLEAVAIAFLVGTISGSVVGFILGMSRFLDGVFGPFLVPLNSIPRIALAPLFILWFGLTTNAKVWLAVSLVFFVLTVNARAAVKSVDPDLMVMGRVIGFKRRDMLLKIVAPSAVPAIFAGIRLSITYSLLGVIGSEMIAAKDGLGQDIVYYSSTFDIATMFAILLELIVVATFINVAAERLEHWLLRWQ
jgi:NitT/TauT family transport system permease protein